MALASVQRALEEQVVSPLVPRLAQVGGVLLQTAQDCARVAGASPWTLAGGAALAAGATFYYQFRYYSTTLQYL